MREEEEEEEEQHSREQQQQQQQQKESERASERGKYPLSEREFRARERERFFNGESTFVLPKQKGAKYERQNA